MKLDNRWAGIFIGAMCLATTTATDAAGRPNLIFIMVDDNRAKDI